MAGPGDVPGKRENAGPEDVPGNISIPSRNILPPHIEEKTFGIQLLFPTTRRPLDFCRPRDFHQTSSMTESANFEDLQTWFNASKISIGTHLTTQEREKAIRLLFC